MDAAYNEYQRRRLQIEGMRVRDVDIVFAGDSIIEEGYWQHWFPEKDILNVGAPRTTTYNLYYRRNHITRVHPDKIFIMVGINDLLISKVFLEIEQLVRMYELLLLDLEDEAPHAKIYVNSIIPTAEFWERDFNLNVIAPINERIEEMCLAVGCKFIDLTTELVASDGFLDHRFTDDGLHLNALGYQKWLEKISPMVLE
ncbi:GDSL-type esterase/lipase family protein [Tepidamorphus sp. 3E244]|uniref:GDSL-type esterase/lipase family protein n=1 Tax=Tepidamorphus sp. 3E244 TaxID=3385498 RepID=UPI0038FC49D8